MRIVETQLVRALSELSEGKQLTAVQLAGSLKSFLKRKRLMRRAGKVLRALEAYAQEKANLVVVRVTSAHPLVADAKQSVQAKVTELFGQGNKKTQVTFHIDPKLIGGVRLETDNVRYDFSLSRTLIELHKSFSK